MSVFSVRKYKKVITIYREEKDCEINFCERKIEKNYLNLYNTLTNQKKKSYFSVAGEYAYLPRCPSTDLPGMP